MLFVSLFLALNILDFFPRFFPDAFGQPEISAKINTDEALYGGKCAPIAKLETLNGQISTGLTELKSTTFFKTYKINLERECPFWDQQRLCDSNKCVVEESPKEKVPLFWQKSLGDDHQSIFVDLTQNQELHTGYEGKPVWAAISNNTLLDQDHRVDQLESEDSYTEKTFLYHLISGFHASVNTHISQRYTNELQSNHTYFLNQIGSHPERVKNLHFLYAAVVKAVSLMNQRKLFLENDYTTSVDGEEKDAQTKKLVANVMLLLPNDINSNDDWFTFKFDKSQTVRELHQQVAHISEIIDCVSCDKCRLNGKVQIEGLAIALKVLFPMDAKKQSFSQSELISIMQLFIKLSEAVAIVRKSRDQEDLQVNKVFLQQLAATIVTSAFLTFFIKTLACDDSNIEEADEESLGGGPNSLTTSESATELTELAAGDRADDEIVPFARSPSPPFKV